MPHLKLERHAPLRWEKDPERAREHEVRAVRVVMDEADVRDVRKVAHHRASRVAHARLRTARARGAGDEVVVHVEQLDVECTAKVRLRPCPQTAEEFPGHTDPATHPDPEPTRLREGDPRQVKPRERAHGSALQDHEPALGVDAENLQAGDLATAERLERAPQVHVREQEHAGVMVRGVVEKVRVVRASRHLHRKALLRRALLIPVLQPEHEVDRELVPVCV